LARRVQPAAPRPKRQFENRSADHIAHARKALEKKRDKRARTKLQDEVAARDSALAVVSSSFPQAARACGLKAPKAQPLHTSAVQPSRREELPETRAANLLSAAFIPPGTRVPRGLGVRHSRLVAFAAELLKTLQEEGICMFLSRLAWW
jgi:hypothetical protein